MPKSLETFTPREPERRFGDGHITLNRRDFFKNPKNYDQVPTYFQQLVAELLRRFGLDPQKIIHSPEHQPKLMKLCGCLIRQFKIAFSNGCPNPKSALFQTVSIDLTRLNNKQLRYPYPKITLDDVIATVKKEAYLDGRHNFLYGYLLDRAAKAGNTKLIAELETESEWQTGKHDEFENTPHDLDGKLSPVSGLAGAAIYDQVISPLRALIDKEHAPQKKRAVVNKVLDLIDYMARSCTTVTAMADLVTTLNR